MRLPHGATARKVRLATPMLVAVELVSAITRRIGDPECISETVRQLEAFSQTELAARHRDLGARLARLGTTRGADRAIPAQAPILAKSAPSSFEFVTADGPQARAVRAQAEARNLTLTVTQVLA